MTPKEVQESQQLISSHNSLRWNIARNREKDVYIQLIANSDDRHTTSATIPGPIGGQILTIALALVESRLRELGVTPETGLDHDCFECSGSGKTPME